MWHIALDLGTMNVQLQSDKKDTMQSPLQKANINGSAKDIQYWH